MILLLAGTSDAKEIAFALHENKLPMMASVSHKNAATDYIEKNIPVRIGPLDSTEMSNFIRENNINIVADATHPFAEATHQTAMQAAKDSNVTYIRYERQNTEIKEEYKNSDKLFITDSYEECVSQTKELIHEHESHKNKNVFDDYNGKDNNKEETQNKNKKESKCVVMLTTGTKNLEMFTDAFLKEEQVETIARVLPRSESILECERLGVKQSNIVAIQGPFSEEMNRLFLEKYRVNILVTKESGKEGSTQEKIKAAIDLGIRVVLIARPKLEFHNIFHTRDDILTEIKKITK